MRDVSQRLRPGHWRLGIKRGRECLARRNVETEGFEEHGGWPDFFLFLKLAKDEQTRVM